jgi:hypothetical protein
MGLDIRSFQKLQPVTDPKAAIPFALIVGGDEDGCVLPLRFAEREVAYTEEYWPGRAEGITGGIDYNFADTLAFRAGSYSGYDEWRNWLAKVGGWSSAEDCWVSGKTEGPFLELICFSDCDGLIGPKISAKLARDFAQFETKAEELSPNEWCIGLYREWRAAFEMAADGGAVWFH